MANTISAERRIRRNEARRVINKNRLSRVRTFIKCVDHAILGGNVTEATQAFDAMTPELMRGASKGVVHKNFVARQMGRLAGKIKALKEKAA
jgi:small subunit ribosomal protein S20